MENWPKKKIANIEICEFLIFSCLMLVHVVYHYDYDYYSYYLGGK